MSRRDKRRARFGMAYLGYPKWPHSMARTRRAVAAVEEFAAMVGHPMVPWQRALVTRVLAERANAER